MLCNYLKCDLKIVIIILKLQLYKQKRSLGTRTYFQILNGKLDRFVF